MGTGKLTILVCTIQGSHMCYIKCIEKVLIAISL